jgi:hypothetical protein
LLTIDLLLNLTLTNAKESPERKSILPFSCQ